MASEMVERVAKVLADEFYKVGWYDRNDVFFKRRWNSIAVAAIEAMMEPTQEMIDCGPPEPYMDKAVWKSMITAALDDNT